MALLKSGWLVIPDIHIHGCVSYVVEDKQEEADGERLEGDWKTHKTVESVVEQKLLGQVRYEIIKLVADLGHTMSAGIFVPEDKEQKLQLALDEVQSRIDVYNAQAKHTKISGQMIPFRIGSDDSVVGSVVWNHAKEAMEDLRTAVDAADVKGIRDVLGQRIRRMEEMLPEGQGKKLSAAVKTCKELAKQLKRKADGKKNTLPDIDTSSIEEAEKMVTEVVSNIGSMTPNLGGRMLDLD